MANIKDILGPVALSGLLLLASEGTAVPQSHAIGRTQDSTPAESPATQATLYEKLKSYLDQNGRIKRENYVGWDFRIEGNRNEVMFFICETYRINEKKLEVCYTMVSNAEITEDGTKHRITDFPTWYRFEGKWYTDDADGLNGNEKLRVPSEQNIAPPNQYHKKLAPLNLQIAHK